MENDDGGTHL